jgi:hypothetical protein
MKPALTHPPDERPVLPVPKAYRKLSEEELALMDDLNALREQVRKFVEHCRNFDTARGALHDMRVLAPARALAIAETDLQSGFMWVARAIAAPGFF